MNINSESGTDLAGVTRRRLLKQLLGFAVVSTVVGALTPIIGYLWPPKTSNVGDIAPTMIGAVDEYPLGVGKVLAVNNQPVIVVNTEQGIRAYSAICTHLGCVVLDKEPSLGYIKCPCHDGRFNPLNGAVIGGPPPRPLPAYAVSVADRKIYVGKPLSPLYRG